jgi:hypothetical protein
MLDHEQVIANRVIGIDVEAGAGRGRASAHLHAET